MLKRRLPYSPEALSHNEAVHRSRIAKLGRNVLSKVVSVSKSVHEKASDRYYAGAYHTGRALEGVKGLLGKAWHGSTAYVNGVEYGHRYYEKADDYVSRMERKGVRGHLYAAGVAVAALSAYVVASRLGLLDCGVVEAAQPTTGVDASPRFDASFSLERHLPVKPDHVEVATPTVSVETSDPRPELKISDGGEIRLSRHNIETVDALLDGRTVAPGESVWTIMEDLLKENGIKKPGDGEIALFANDFSDRHSDHLTAEGWLREGQVLETTDV